MTLKELEYEFSLLPKNYKTKDVDTLNKKLIKRDIDVSFLKNIVLDKQKYHRTFFQVSLMKLKKNEEKFKFIEDNFYNINDWWHVDQLTQFISKVDLDFAYNKAKEYVNHKWTFARRWGYVLFMPTLVKDSRSFNMIVSLLKNDNEYYVVMAEAWLISYLAIYYPDKTLNYLKDCDLNYDIVGRAIQKICDSFRISNEYKLKFKEIRKKYK